MRPTLAKKARIKMLNRVILMGRLVADPELRQTPNAVSVATFRIAVERDYGGKDRQTDFIPCVAWRQTGEFISRYFSKGRMIAVQGQLQSRSYEDKAGQKRTVYEVIVDQAYFADSRPAEGRETQSSQTQEFGFAPPALGSVSSKMESFGSFDIAYGDEGDLPF